METIVWSVWAVLIVVSAVAGWTGSAALQRRWRLEGGPERLLVWNRPDLARPSTSPEARAEVAELEALWRRSS